MKNYNIFFILFGIMILIIAIGNPLDVFAISSCDEGYWRIASYWAGTGISQQGYDTYNIFHHFNIEPLSGGYISEVNGMSESSTRGEINEIHAHGDLVLATIGGWGYGPAFQSATNTDSKRQIFAEQIAKRVWDYGYDGAVIDWEEDVNNDDLFEAMKKIRIELDKYNPELLLNIDVCCDVNPSNVARIAPYVNSINTMGYGSAISSDYAYYTNAGVPSEKIVGGIEFGNWANSPTKVREAAQYIKDMNLKGIETWELSGLTSSYSQEIINVLGSGQACSTGANINPSSGADTDNDCNVNRGELGNYILQWKNGQVSRTQLGIAIQLWVEN